MSSMQTILPLELKVARSPKPIQIGIFFRQSVMAVSFADKGSLFCRKTSFHREIRGKRVN